MIDHPRPSTTPRNDRPRRHLLATPVGAGTLTLLVIALVAAIVVLPEPGTGPSGGPRPTCGLGPAIASCPAAASTATASPTQVPIPSFVRPTPTPGPTFTSYVVRAGDSLTSIARMFRTSPRSLAWWNRGAHPSLDPESEGYRPNHIEPEWVLVLIPGMIVDDAAAPTASPGGPTVPPTIAPSASPA